MGIDAVLVWGGFTVAILDSTGYGGEINALFDRIVNRTAYYLKNKHSPVSSWMRSFNVWLMVEQRLRDHRKGINPLPRAFAEHPPFKEKIIPFRYLRWRRERSLAFRGIKSNERKKKEINPKEELETKETKREISKIKKE